MNKTNRISTVSLNLGRYATGISYCLSRTEWDNKLGSWHDRHPRTVVFDKDPRPVTRLDALNIRAV